MPDPLITLTTDFGEDSPYVAAMKGSILSINPSARLLDLSHQVPPQDVRHAAFFLATALPYFPAGVIHVVVVDPGVGSARAVLYVAGGGQHLLVPDNGCWTLLAGSWSRPPMVRRLAEPAYWRHPVSATFHGRDIFAPAASWLSRSLDPACLGPVVTEWVQLEDRPPTVAADAIHGEVVFVDHFGNLITNVSAALLAGLGERPLSFQVGEQVVQRQVRTYADAEPGQLVALFSSSGMLEFAVAQGNAARRLQMGIGTAVLVRA